ncbi:MAG: ABC transporter ATP-binding protein [Burkholderiales bacterium]|nr:ABC transporter ATP-binding protein [Burkholderiales bacterium]
MTTTLLATRGLTRRFGGLTAVSSVDLDVGAGEIVGMIGPNGAGKSTLFNMIAGALVPTSGSIELDGVRVDGLAPHAIAARGVMRTFQHNRPFAGMSVVENVMIGMQARPQSSLLDIIAGTRAAARFETESQARARELIDFVGLGDWIGAEVTTLSFGQGRLLEIARALAGSPRLIMLDEPAAGLTAAECDRVAAIVREIAGRGVAVLVIEHDMRFLMPLAERVAVLNFGQLIATGTPAQVQAHPQVVEAYLGDLGALADA